VADYRPSDLTSAPHTDLAKENERLRLENRVLKEGEAAQIKRGIIENRTDILKKAQGRMGSSSARGSEAMNAIGPREMAEP
jgi:transposase